MQKEEDYSVALIDIPRDPETISLVILDYDEKQGKHHHTAAIESFKQEFSKIYGDKFYDNLGNLKNFNDQLLLLRILLEVSVVKSVETKFKQLDIGKNLTWNEVLDLKSRPKLSYQLSVINKVKGINKWIINFIKKGGVEHI